MSVTHLRPTPPFRHLLAWMVPVALLTAVPSPAPAQGVWVPHQDPCQLSTGHYLVKGSMVHLKLAVESRFPDERGDRLAEAKEVLDEAILEKGQDGNPAAWYYLGRVYAEQRDYPGADSAFRRAVAGAPDCADDVAVHAGKLAALSLNEALRLWGAAEGDSARLYFAYALALDSTDAEVPLYAAIMFSAEHKPDSAAAFLERGEAAARGDTAHASRTKQARLAVAQAYDNRAMQQTPAVLTVAQTRVLRDSAVRQVERDSATFARIVTEVQGIRERGQQLNAQSLAAFQRDSTLLATRLTAGRQARDSLGRAAASDSAAVAGALERPIAYYERYVAEYPEEVDAATQLVRMYSAAGERAALDTIVQRLAVSPHPSASSLVQAGLSLYNDGLPASARLLLEAALARNAYDLTALGVLTHVCYAEGRADDLFDIGQRRMALAPLDPSSARTLAMAWDLRGNADSTRYWVAMADTGLGWHVRVSQFQPGSAVTSVSGNVQNPTRSPQPPLVLDFEFLDADGQVLMAETVTIPALDPQGRAPLSVRLEQGGAAAWRYRKH